MTGAANAIFGIIGDDGGKWESTFAPVLFAPIVIVLVAKNVNLVVIVKCAGLNANAK